MRNFFSGIDAPYVAEVTTTLFFLLFVGVLLWSLRPGASKSYEEAAALPLEEDDPEQIKEENEENQ